MRITVPLVIGQPSAIRLHATGIRLALLVVAALVTPLCTRVVAQPVCAGDCNGDGGVTVNEIIALVNMALGVQTQLSVCPNGLPSSITDVSQINVSVIIQAVNSTLQNSCENSPGNDCSYYPTASSQAACDAVAAQQQCSSSYFYAGQGYSYCALGGCLCIGD